jgi:hypothetical protein
MTAAAHGTISSYRGSATRAPCRCATCKSGWAEYMRNRRTKSVAERTGTRVVKPTNVVTMTPRPKQPAAPSAGEQELAVIARLDQIFCDDVAVRARCVAMARVLDDAESGAQWVSAAKQLDAMMVRIEGPPKRRKSNTGKLAIMNAMSRPHRGRAAQ